MRLNRRYLRIVVFFARLILHIVAWEVILRRLGLGGLAERSIQSRYTRWAQRFRALAVRLGGVMIKVGQFLSARVDVLPEYVTSELSGLQDEVPPEPFEDIRVVIESELGKPLDQCFVSVDPGAQAAASLGQTHRAVLPTGEHVIVKVLRPRIEAIVEIDLAALATVAQWVKRYRPIRRRANVEALLKEFGETLRGELDYVAEARHAARFAEMFAEDPSVHIPRIFSDYSTRRVLTLEDVGFIKITDYDAITAAGVDRTKAAQRLFRTYMHQIFDQGFFHADPHPGNLFVEPLGEAQGWRLVFVDFGMVGEITPEIRAGLREAAIAVGTRDPRRLIQAAVSLGAILPGADLERIVQAETAAFDRFWGKSMSELRQTSFREVEQFSRQFRDLLFELPFQVPENLIYLGRMFAILSGMCTGLDPNFNLFAALTPFARRLMEQELSDQGADYWLKELELFARRLLALPGRLDRVLTRLERGELSLLERVNGQGPRERDSLASAVNRLTGALVFSGLLAVGTLLYFNGQAELGVGGWGLAGAVLVWTLMQK
jgi:predicted unusual protein kinase regulating ubiquinone biosynthesis (AarF/ABC1/UbiB family)